MKTKLITIIISLLMFTACAPDIPHEHVEDQYEQVEESSAQQDRFVVFESKSYHYKLVYDRETLVEYFYAPSGFGSNSGSDFLTPLLDADGKPKLHNQKTVFIESGWQHTLDGQAELW